MGDVMDRNTDWDHHPVSFLLVPPTVARPLSLHSILPRGTRDSAYLSLGACIGFYFYGVNFYVNVDAEQRGSHALRDTAVVEPTVDGAGQVEAGARWARSEHRTGRRGTVIERRSRGLCDRI